MTRSLMLAGALIALVVTACGPRSLDRDLVVDVVTEPASSVPTASTLAVHSEPAVPTRGGSTAGSELLTDEAQSHPDPAPVPTEGGDQAVQPDIEKPDVDELDELLADVDAALAGIDLDADEGDMP